MNTPKKVVKIIKNRQIFSRISLECYLQFFESNNSLACHPRKVFKRKKKSFHFLFPNNKSLLCFHFPDLPISKEAEYHVPHEDAEHEHGLREVFHPGSAASEVPLHHDRVAEGLTVVVSGGAVGRAELFFRTGVFAKYLQNRYTMVYL